MSSLTEHPEIMKQIVTDNYQYPRGVKTVDDPSFLTVHMDSASCIDDIYIQIRIEDGKIAEAYWHGSGCAISMASTSIMTQIIKGKTVEEARRETLRRRPPGRGRGLRQREPSAGQDNLRQHRLERIGQDIQGSREGG